MFNKLYYDIIEVIVLNLSDIRDIINFSISNKIIYKTIDDSLFTSWARKKYSDEFWENAKKRTPVLSKPFYNMKYELIRLYNFELQQIKYGNQLWSSKDYYLYWNSLEKSIKCIYKKYNIHYID